MNETAPPIPRAKFLRKISPKTVMDEVGVDLMNLPRPVQARVLYDLFGSTNRVKQGQTDKGPWVAFLGEFQAVTPDGEIFDSGKAHIPVMEDILFMALAKAQEEDAKSTVNVALRIAIKPAPAGKPSATGYEFDVQSILPAKQSNTIAMLKQQAAAHAGLLPAPKTAPTQEVAGNEDGKAHKRGGR